MKEYLRLDSSGNLKINGSDAIGYKRQKSFDVPLRNVKIVGLKYEMPFDDEQLYICFIDKYGVSNNVNSYFLDDSSISILVNHFNFTKEHFRAEHNSYLESKSVIFFPKELEGQQLYKKWNCSLGSMLNRLSRFFMLRYASEGVLSDVVLDNLN